MASSTAETRRWNRPRTVTPYVLDDDFEWVLDEANATTETRTRDLTVSEQVPCEIPIRAIPVDPTVIGPDCDTAGTVVLPSSTVGYEWVKQEDGTYNAVADPGYYLDPTVQIFDPGDLSQTTGDVCADVQSASPVPAEVQVEVASQSPVVVPAAAPTTQAAVVAATPTQLPSTGSSSWVTGAHCAGDVARRNGAGASEPSSDRLNTRTEHKETRSLGGTCDRCRPAV